jgi:hypothetical protein
VISRNQLTCERTACGRTFTARRRDARFCSRSCRRAKSPPAPLVEVVEPAISAAEEEVPAATGEDLHGWRRVGPYLIPPFDPRNVVRVDDWLQ